MINYKKLIIQGMAETTGLPDNPSTTLIAVQEATKSKADRFPDIVIPNEHISIIPAPKSETSASRVVFNNPSDEKEATARIKTDVSVDPEPTGQDSVSEIRNGTSDESIISQPRSPKETYSKEQGIHLEVQVIETDINLTASTKEGNHDVEQKMQDHSSADQGMDIELAPLPHQNGGQIHIDNRPIEQVPESPMDDEIAESSLMTTPKYEEGEDKSNKHDYNSRKDCKETSIDIEPIAGCSKDTIPQEPSQNPCCSKSLDGGNGSQSDNLGKKEKYGTEEKVPLALSPEDITAINTVKYICFWYCFCIGGAVILTVIRSVLDHTLSEESNLLLQNISAIFLAMNSSFNFCFYVRSKNFRNVFKKRYRLQK